MEQSEGKKRLAVLTVLLALAVSLLLTGCKSGTGESVDWDNLKDIAGTIWYAGDTRIEFDDQGNFTWDDDASNLEENYMTGTYTLYWREDALNYITEELDKGYTREGIKKVTDNNRDLKEENFIALVLHVEKINWDEETTKRNQRTLNTIVDGDINTYGYFILKNQYMYVVNVESGDYYKFRH